MYCRCVQLQVICYHVLTNRTKCILHANKSLYIFIFTLNFLIKKLLKSATTKTETLPQIDSILPYPLFHLYHNHHSTFKNLFSTLTQHNHHPIHTTFLIPQHHPNHTTFLIPQHHPIPTTNPTKTTIQNHITNAPPTQHNHHIPPSTTIIIPPSPPSHPVEHHPHNHSHHTTPTTPPYQNLFKHTTTTSTTNPQPTNPPPPPATQWNTTTAIVRWVRSVITTPPSPSSQGSGKKPTHTTPFPAVSCAFEHFVYFMRRP